MNRVRLLICLILLCIGIVIVKKSFADVSATVTIPAQNSDFQLQYDTTTNTDPVEQNTQVTYQITYGSHLTYVAPITIQASWDQGIIQGPQTSVDIVNYVDGSATNAYGNTPPVIDLINRTITWTITSFPAQTTDQIITFTLVTDDNYTGANTVSFQTHAQLTNDSLILPQQTVTKNYVYNPFQPTATPTPTPSPTPTPTPTATPTPEQGGTTTSQTSTPTPTPTIAVTPTPTPENQQNTSPIIEVQSVSSTSLSLSVQTADLTTLHILYGTTIGSLTQTQDIPTFANQHVITLSNLSPNTGYFIQVTATNKNKKIVTSDIYFLRTAITAPLPTFDKNSLIITSDNSILVNPTTGVAEQPLLVLQKGQTFEFRFSIANSTAIKKIQVIVRSNVLGFNTFTNDQTEPNSNQTDLIQITPGIYVGRLKAPKIFGNSEIFIHIIDTNGNIFEEKIADLHVSDYLMVINRNNNTPIEGAQIMLYFFNAANHKYEILPSLIFPIQNPIYSNSKGQTLFALPLGKYLAKVRALGFSGQDIPFTLDASSGYPKVYLTESPFNIATFTSYYTTTFMTFSNTTNTYIQSLAVSDRLFVLNTIIIMFTLVILTLFAFASRLNIPLRSLATYLVYHRKIAQLQTNTGEKITGRLCEENTQVGITHADIYLIDEKNKKIFDHTTTDMNGYFSFLQTTARFAIEIMKNGYGPIYFDHSQFKQFGQNQMLFTMGKKKPLFPIMNEIKIIIEKILSLIFEILLVTSLVFEYSMGFALGWGKVLPFFLFSLLNLGIWLLHLSHLHQEKNIL